MNIRERLAFWRQSRGRFQTTGAIQPSSRFLARAMTDPLRTARPRGPVHIVEMGPGTGAVTAGIAVAMEADDELDCFELNPEFARFLRERIAVGDAFAAARDRVRVHVGDARQAAIGRPADFVVCSIPLNNLDAAAVDDVFRAGRQLLRNGGWFTYFEYVLLPRLRAATASADERRRIAAVRAAKLRFRGDRALTDVVLLNVPPARAVHVHLAGEPG